MAGRGLGCFERTGEGLTAEWYTPKYITDALGPFDLDPCAATVRKWDIGRRNYTKADDGLSLPWEGRVWLNCPYGRETRLWLRRLADHGDGVALVFARTETGTFFESVWPAASGIFFFRGRVRFLNEAGVEAGHPAAPSCLVAYDRPGSRRNLEALRTCGLEGRTVEL